MAPSTNRDPRKALCKAIRQTRSDPKPDSVHEIRSQIRRVLAHLHVLPETDELHRFTKIVKPLIRAAGKVRDLDIQAGLLADLPPSPVLQPAIDELSRHLAKKRRHRATRLQQLLAQRHSRIKDSLQSFNPEAEVSSSFTVGVEQEQQQRRNTEILRFAQNDERFKASLLQKRNAPKPAKYITDRAAAEFRQATDALDPGDPDELHQIRKAARDARYLIEAHSPDQPLPAARHFHRLQQEIGVWHDWLTLTQAAHRYLPALSPLHPVLEQLRDRHHRNAAKLVASGLRGKESAKLSKRATPTWRKKQSSHR